jgi:hypothetical protein
VFRESDASQGSCIKAKSAERLCFPSLTQASLSFCELPILSFTNLFSVLSYLGLTSLIATTDI